MVPSPSTRNDPHSPTTDPFPRMPKEWSVWYLSRSSTSVDNSSENVSRVHTSCTLGTPRVRLKSLMEAAWGVLVSIANSPLA